MLAIRDPACMGFMLLPPPQLPPPERRDWLAIPISPGSFSEPLRSGRFCIPLRPGIPSPHGVLKHLFVSRRLKPSPPLSALLYGLLLKDVVKPPLHTHKIPQDPPK